MDFNLTQRQQNILLAIVMDYIATAEPVGSRTISKKYDLGLSPATIRNDMSDLEELGLLRQPHSSAGRIPSDLGYRKFVDYLMQKTELLDEEKQIIKTIQNDKLSNLEQIIEKSARILSALSNTMAIIKFPEGNKDFVKHFKILPINDMTFVIVIVSTTGKVHDYLVQLQQPVEEYFFHQISEYFNNEIVGTPINELQKKLNELVTGNIEYDNILRGIYRSIKDSLSQDKSKICVTGTSNLLKEPEFLENEKAHSLVNFFEAQGRLKEFSDVFMEIGATFHEKPIILIGHEISISQLQNCSLIVGSYNVGDSITGAIGLLGPTRMHYGKSIAALEEMTKNLSYLLTKLYDVRGS
ncbi:MAG: heat-inducible transcriptional repressor HrcA [Candidatus Sericytochromatia bacterium]